ncbi:MAG: ABC transporter permease [Panacibacter sp.]
MLYHNLKLAFRNLRRHKTFSLINILSLALGLTSCIIIGLYAYTELSFDTFHSSHAQIYRVNKLTNEKDKGSQRDASTPGQLAPALEKDFPEVAAATRFRPWFTEMLVSYDKVRIKLDDVAYADASFLKLFNFPLLRGDKKTALTEPNTAVITEATAAKYFKNTDPIGKTLVTLNNIPVRITGVAKDVPFNSSLKFTMLISWATITAPSAANYFSWMDNWNSMPDYTFVQLKENASAANVGDKISTLMHKYRSDDGFSYKPYLQPLDEIHLHSADVQYAEQFQTNSSMIIYMLLIIAAFILLIACFNFINLTTAGALGRAKETGVQKVLGAGQWQLVRKFFTESFLLCALALVISVVLVTILMPLFNSLAGTGLSAEILFQWKVMAALAALLLLISVIAGLYPAVFLSRFKSTDVFRNTIKAGKNSWLRKSLVTTQFALSVVLIIGTIIVNNQMHYLSEKDLGFDKDQVIVIQLANTNLESSGKSNTFINSLKSNPGIASVSASNRVPGQTFSGYGVIPEGHTLDEHMNASVVETDADFASTYNIQILKGRYFSSKMPTDTTDAIVINEAMAKSIGWNDPIGKQFEIYEARKGKVIGVVKDFNFASLHDAVQPLAVILKNNPLYVSVKLKAGNIPASLDFIQKQWKQFDQQFPFDYSFLDEQLNKLYKSDTRLMQVLNIFAALAICIASMGLFGLSIYSAKQRTKEIGIRKVLGASVSQVTLLLSKDFIQLVAIAIVIASPVAWWASNKWLQTFTYRVTISWWMFALAGIIAICIALFTVSFQAIKAAVANPVKSLRTE